MEVSGRLLGSAYPLSFQPERTQGGAKIFSTYQKHSKRFSGKPARALKLAVTALLGSNGGTGQVNRFNSGSRGMPDDQRLALLVAVGTSAIKQAEKTVLSVGSEVLRLVNPEAAREPRSFEEALMTTPRLETIPYKVLERGPIYEIREVESFMIAETVMPGQTGFDFFSSSEGFNRLAGYLFGKNRSREEMEMTTPVISRGQAVGVEMEMTTPVITRSSSKGEEMEMTTPVFTSQEAQSGGGPWRMSFLLPSKYSEETLPLPDDLRVTVKKVPVRIMAVLTFSGLVSDAEVRQREVALRSALASDNRYLVRPGAAVEVAQYNPPFTPPPLRRNEVALEVMPSTGVDSI